MWEDRGADIQISVIDNGIGVPEGMKDRIFDMFTEAKRHGTAGEKSFGLSLSICRQIIEAHDDKIWWKNNPDSGATFAFSLKKD